MTGRVFWIDWAGARSGHLFQGRFKSFLISEDAYLYRLLYIHRNPLRAKIVVRLAGEYLTEPSKIAERES